MLTEAFLARIRLSGTEIDMKHLPLLLRHVADYIPFENLDIIEGASEVLSEEGTAKKILQQQRGGLCYEINPLLATVLTENDFHVQLISAVIYDALHEEFSKTGYTHTLILLEEHGEQYLVDAGFGNNVPLIAVPLDGRTVSSTNGDYRIEGNDLYMKRRYRDEQFVLAYRFDTQPITKSQLRTSQQIIENSEDSVFNKRPLLTKCTEDGTVTLSGNDLTIMKNGHKTLTTLTNTEKEAVKKQYFYQ